MDLTLHVKGHKGICGQLCPRQNELDISWLLTALGVSSWGDAVTLSVDPAPMSGADADLAVGRF